MMHSSATKDVRHFLDIDDLTTEELEKILDTSEGFAKQLTQAFEEGECVSEVLKGKGVALFFEKASLRTRHSMEMAVSHLGGHPISIRNDEVGLGSRESVSDIVRTLGGYHFAIGARVFAHSTLEEMVGASPVPIFNMLSDKAHPFQALADLLTIRQNFQKLEGIKLAYVGDANNVAASLALAAKSTGMSFHIAHPESYGFADYGFSDMEAGDMGYIATQDPKLAVADADVVYTDVWTSMGQESEAKKRQKAFQGFGVTEELMALAKPSAIFLHCLPAHRGEEVAGGVIDGNQSRVWQQAQNRMFTSMGYFAWLACQDVNKGENEGEDNASI